MFNFKTTYNGTVFYKNILTLLKGSFLAQLIPLIISPFITRLYSPKELGILALFSSISVIGKVNVDDNSIIPSEYGIRNIPALLIFKNGEIVDKVIGAVPKTVLSEKLDAQL